MKTRWFALTACAGAAALWFAWPGQAEKAGSLLPYQDAEALALGEALYGEHCAACHGADLEGQVSNWRDRDAEGMIPAPPHDETGHTWHHPDAMLFAITKLGTEAVVGQGYRSNMGGFEGILTDEEILATLAWIKSTWPQEVVEAHDEINARYEATRN
ncbi:c-type cytochrome [Vannielia litorea]|uniref:Cytochrome c, mono-and diheme variants n=1 Tax=Vannielia litorea TaxID=1217970 RepID=A0A1N6ILT3_9RHOB|nr:c-type cytochrome [Vannielia litorea]SIO32980.1 Cytochrome c, mono-and diheme variants [Vannielia litorea]